MDQPDYKDPYTGLSFEIDHVFGRGWVAVGIFDPCQWFDSEEALVRALSVRNGEPRQYKRLRCAYTGKNVSIVHNERLNKYRAVGIFDPKRVFDNPDEAVYALSFRNGVAPKFPEHPPKIRVSEPNEPRLSTADDLGKSSEVAAMMVDAMFGEKK